MSPCYFQVSNSRLSIALTRPATSFRPPLLSSSPIILGGGENIAEQQQQQGEYFKSCDAAADRPSYFLGSGGGMHHHHQRQKAASLSSPLSPHIHPLAQGCQMATAKFLDCMRLALQA